VVRNYENWLVEENSHVAELSLNRAGVKNTLNSETLYELRDICETLSHKTEISVIVLRGEGDHFSTGLDPNLIRDGLGKSEEYVHDLVAGHHECLSALENIEKPTVAAIHGFCIGGGLLLALCCDFRIASQRTFFSLPEIKLGLPILWGTHRIVRTIGVANAKRMIMIGDRFGVMDALEWGLLHRVVQEKELQSAVDSLVNKLMKIPPRTLGIAKRLINASANHPERGTEEMELQVIDELQKSPDLQEALDSYFEGRQPRYRGE
jgi:enoyl-CoA hydratase/carnithine racemase